MTPRDLLAILKRRGCVVLRQKGSHVRVQCGKCQTTIPVHNEDLKPGTLSAIKRQLKPCLGDKWLSDE